MGSDSAFGEPFWGTTKREIFIPGEPVAKARPRVTRAGMAYTPKKTVNYETLVKELYWAKYAGQAILEGPLVMKVIAYFSIPQSTSKKKRIDMVAGTIRPTKKPDLDNLIKSVADALNGIAYADDSYIVQVEAQKYWGDRPGVLVEIRPLQKEGVPC